jgi:hypothetical protein
MIRLAVVMYIRFTLSLGKDICHGTIRFPWNKAWGDVRG